MPLALRNLMQLLQYNLIRLKRQTEDKMEIKTKFKSQNYNNLGNPAYTAHTHSNIHVDGTNVPQTQNRDLRRQAIKPSVDSSESSELWMN